MKYVSLATDAAPTYAVHAPVAARLWLRLGYKTIIHVEDTDAWRSSFGQVVLEELGRIEAAVVRIPVVPPLKLANTMRASRLVAPWVNGLYLDDYILMADVDMYPLSRTFFASPADFTVLRALYASWLGCTTPPPVIDWSAVRPGWRFQMCYAGARVDIWREMWWLRGDSSAAALRTMLEGTEFDASDFDEAKLSYAFLSSPRAQGEWVWTDSFGIWKKGELVFVDPLGAPLLSRYHNMPRGLIGPEDRSLNEGVRPGAIDLIPPRFTREAQPWWPLELAAQYWPEEAEWLHAYRARIEPTIGVFPWR